MKITVLGDGAFGTALAQVCARNGHDVTIWCYNSDVAQLIETKRCNERYLPSIILDERIKAVTMMETALRDAQWIIEAIPVKFMYPVVGLCRPFVQESVPWVVASKGIDYETMRLPAHMLYHGLEMEVPYVVLSGPSFADELAKGEPTAVVLASNELALAARFKRVIDNDTFFSSITQDTTGVQLCGVIKNTIAIALGILEGAGYEKNAQAFALTQAMAELALIVNSVGGQESTVLSLAGVGDIALTAHSPKSRNHTLGLQIGKGNYEAFDTGSAEGINSIHALKNFAQLAGKQSTAPLFQLPFFSALYDVVLHKKNAQELINACRFSE